jgi:hypothetical protein
MAEGQFEGFEEETKTRGFNPLFLASVLVIITVLIAASLSFWATSLSKKDKTPTSASCGGSISLYSGTYDSGGKKLTLIVNNKGEPLMNVKLYFDYLNGDVREFETGTLLPKNAFETISVNGVDPGFSIGALTTECDSIKLDFVNQEGTIRQV